MGLICVWPDGTWCWQSELEEYQWKSDDFYTLDASNCESEEEVEELVMYFNMRPL